MRWRIALICAAPAVLAAVLLAMDYRPPEKAAGASDTAIAAPNQTAGTAAVDGAEPVDWSDVDEDGFVELDWLQMLPADELEQLQSGSSISHFGDQRMTQVGSSRVVKSVLGRKIKLPGYVVPLEMDDSGRVSEFFLVPYYGACIHVPPPPPNQMVYVRLARPLAVPDIWEVYWIKGELSDLKTQTPSADAAYFMGEARLAPYED
jgi:uncharacterized protein